MSSGNYSPRRQHSGERRVMYSPRRFAKSRVIAQRHLRQNNSHKVSRQHNTRPRTAVIVPKPYSHRYNIRVNVVRPRSSSIARTRTTSVARVVPNTNPNSMIRIFSDYLKNSGLRRGGGGSLPMPASNFDATYDQTGKYVPLINASYTGPMYPHILQPTYVISVRPERMKNFVTRLGPWSTHCKRGKCVFGKLLDKGQLIREKTLSASWNDVRMGQIGCYLSHLNAWNSILESPYEYGTVMEDDADVRYSDAATIDAKIKAALNELKQQNQHWDILFWNINPTPSVAAKLQDCKLEHWRKVPSGTCMGCIAYTIRKSVLQQYMKTVKPISMPVDYFMMHSFHKYKTYCLYPPLGSVVPTASDTEDQQRPSYERWLRRKIH